MTRARRPLSRTTRTILVVSLSMAVLGLGCASTESDDAAPDPAVDGTTSTSGQAQSDNGDGDATEEPDADTNTTGGDPATTSTSDKASTTTETSSADQPDPTQCQFNPYLGGLNPFGLRTFLRFEDRTGGGSAVVHQGFGNAAGDGAYRWQSVHPDSTAVDVFNRFLDGEQVIDADILTVDATLIADVSATFECEVADPGALADGAWEPPAPLSAASCAFDPALGPNPLGQRSTLTVWELEPGSDFPDPTSIMVLERSGNAVGDGAGWHQTVFPETTATAAFEIIRSDPGYLAEASGDPDTAELGLILDRMEETYRCSTG